MKKTINAFFGYLLLITSLSEAQAQYGYFTNSDGGVYTYITNAGSSAEILGYAGPPWSITIPTNFNDLVVTSISQSAFYGLNDLTSVIIPATLSSIGQTAFGETGLSNVTIPGSVTNIGLAAFINCIELTSIAVGATNSFYTSLDGVLFNNQQTALIEYPGGLAGNYVMPVGVTNVGAEAFDNCAYLSGVTIPSTAISLEDQAFANCLRLTNVVVPDSVTNLGVGVFDDCPDLANVTLSSNITSLPANTFAGCDSLTNIVIPSGLTDIGAEAFYRCSLSIVTIPASVTNIDDGVFYDDYNLINVYFQGDAPTVGANVFLDDNNVTAYYSSGATGWSNSFGYSPSVPAVPLIPFTNTPSFKPFFGIDYSPFTGSQSPNLGTYPTVEQITFDLTNGIVFLASEITTYGMDGTLSNIAAICSSNNIGCYPCAYLSTNNLADNTNELNAVSAVGNSNYPTTMGLIVGSESILQGYSHQVLVSNINAIRAATHTNVLVGTRDVPASLLNNPDVVAASDFIMADIYAYWSQIPITNAAAWTIQQWQAITNRYPGKRVIIGEANWPTSGTNTQWTNPAIVPSVANQGQFLSEFVSMANSNNIEYFIFEYRDEPWKIQEGIGTVEQNWGLLDTNNVKKQSLVNYLSANFSMNAISARNDVVKLSVKTYAGNPYSLLGTTNLDGGWTPIVNFVGALGTNQTVVTLTDSSNARSWFYSAKQNF